VVLRKEADVGELEWITTTLPVFAIVVSAVWAVATIKSTSRLLAREIHGLEKAIERLDKALEKIEDRANDHEIRLRLLEETRCSPS
jgi:prefoldin subunit 5